MKRLADAAQAVDDTRRWLERAVIGLNLCPFAKAVLVKQQVHFSATSARDAAGVLDDLERELDALLALPAQERDTTLLVIPAGFEDFLDFHDLAARADGERVAVPAAERPEVDHPVGCRP